MLPRIPRVLLLTSYRYHDLDRWTQQIDSSIMKLEEADDIEGRLEERDFWNVDWEMDIDPNVEWNPYHFRKIYLMGKTTNGKKP